MPVFSPCFFNSIYWITICGVEKHFTRVFLRSLFISCFVLSAIHYSHLERMEQPRNDSFAFPPHFVHYNFYLVIPAQIVIILKKPNGDLFRILQIWVFPTHSYSFSFRFYCYLSALNCLLESFPLQPFHLCLNIFTFIHHSFHSLLRLINKSSLFSTCQKHDWFCELGFQIISL